MSMQTDVKAVTITGNGALAVQPRIRIKGIHYVATTAGTVDFTVGANNVLSLPVQIGSTYVAIPGEGILCATAPTATYTAAVATLVVFYG